MSDMLHHSGGADVHANAPGSPPGLLNVDPDAPATALHILAYGPDNILHERDVSLQRLTELRAQQRAGGDGAWPVMWVDIVGLGSADVLEGIGTLFDLHPLVLEDVLHVGQRPKVEDYEDYNFIVMRMVSDDHNPTTEQLAMVQFDDCILTFQEQPGDPMEPVRDRIHRNTGRIRKSHADYLVYAIIDAVVDFYAPLLEWLSDRIEDLERQILSQPEPGILGAVYDLKHDVLGIRRALLPMRDAIGMLHREEVPRFSKHVDPYLRDCHDHAVRLLENLQVIREASLSLMDLYMSSVSYHMNEVVKVLTIISTIFIPLSFIAGLYGMNFDPHASHVNMPELGWGYGYLFCLALMGFIAGSLLLWFRRKGWMRSDDLAMRLRQPDE